MHQSALGLRAGAACVLRGERDGRCGAAVRHPWGQRGDGIDVSGWRGGLCNCGVIAALLALSGHWLLSSSATGCVVVARTVTILVADHPQWSRRWLEPGLMWLQIMALQTLLLRWQALAEDIAIAAVIAAVNAQGQCNHFGEFKGHSDVPTEAVGRTGRSLRGLTRPRQRKP